MSYESFQRAKDHFYNTHITLDNVLSCLAISVYIGGMAYIIYRYVT
jgi:hypothetical protein